MANIKKLELVHLNDFHSQFFEEEINGIKTGGASYLIGYIEEKRKRNDNFIFLFAGDAFNGDISDSETMGAVNFLVLNHLMPDVMCLGNHEIDYGMAQLSYLCLLADFPVICANIFAAGFNKTLFKPYLTINKNGFKIFVVGIVTTSISAGITNDKTSVEILYLVDYLEEIKKAYQSEEYKQADMVVILSHIGLPEDKELAKELPNDKFTIIVGGHSHDLLYEPVYVNNIPIVQVGIGSSRLGQFNLFYDEENKKIVDTSYEIIDINEKTSVESFKSKRYFDVIKKYYNRKYNVVICTLSKKLLNEDRNSESEFGDFFADVFNDICHTDLFLFDPGITKAISIGPIIRYADMIETFPMINELLRCRMSGKQLKRTFSYSLAHYGFSNDDDIFVQHTSSRVKIIYDRKTKELLSLLYDDKEVEDEQIYIVGMPGYSLIRAKKKFSVDTVEITNNKRQVVVHPNFVEALYNLFLERNTFNVDNINKRYIAK